MTRILNDREIDVIINLWNKGLGATEIRRIVVRRFKKKISRATIYLHLNPEKDYKRKVDTHHYQCAKCGSEVEGHKRCKVCEVLLHDTPWIADTLVGVEASDNMCYNCTDEN